MLKAFFLFSLRNGAHHLDEDQHHFGFAYFDKPWVYDQCLDLIQPKENEGFVVTLPGKKSSI